MKAAASRRYPSKYVGASKLMTSEIGVSGNGTLEPVAYLAETPALRWGYFSIISIINKPTATSALTAHRAP